MIGIASLYFTIALLALALAAHNFNPLKEPSKFAAGIFFTGSIINLGFSLVWVVRYFSLNQ